MDCCDICGNIGVSDALVNCSQCKLNVEHMYCMRILIEKYPDVWLCEECEKAKQLSSCLLGDLTDVSKTNPMEVCKGGELRVESRKFPNESRVGAGNWEKVAPTGKTKYISVREALTLSSGDKKCFPSSTTANHLKPSRHKSVMGRLHRAVVKPRTVLQNTSSHQNLAFESLRPPNPQRPGNVNVRVKQPQQLRKPTGELRSGSSLRPSDTRKDTLKLKQQPSEAQFPVNRRLGKESPVPSVNASPVAISGGDFHDNAIDREKYSEAPALDALWKGSFTVQDTDVQAKVNHFIEAHPPLRVRRKIYEFSKKMPAVLHFELVPSEKFWNNLFNEHIPDKMDIALYFFPGVGERSEQNYIQLVESISSSNLALKKQIEDVELLVFSSKLFPVNSQRCEGKYFLWGVFHRLKREALLNLDNTILELSLQPADDVNRDQSQVSDREEVDMDIDMIGGIYVGREDIRVAAGEPTGKEIRAATSLPIASAPRGTFDPAAIIPSPIVKKELSDLIPPGFEEVYRLRIQSSSSQEDYVPNRR